MKTSTCLGLCMVVLAASAQVEPVQVPTTRTVLLSKQRSFDEELFRFLLLTHEADTVSDKPALFQVPLLVHARHPGIGVYKFGLASAHAGYCVVFRYQTKLVFARALAAEPLRELARRFLTHYPAAFSRQAQHKLLRQLAAIVTHNQTAGETDLPPRK